MELDLVDKKLLYRLDEDTRESVAVIAKKLNIGRNVALYRINRLKENGIIKGSFAEINNAAIGYLSFRIFLKMGNFTKERESNFFKFLEGNPYLLWLSRVIGKWDIDLVFMSKDAEVFERFRKDIFLRFNDIIEDSHISIMTEILRYPKDYILGAQRKTPSPKIIELGKKHEIDEKDFAILTLLSKDSFIGILDLAKKANLSVNTAKKKLKELEEKKVIIGYRLFIDEKKLGYEYYKLHLYLKNYNADDLTKLRDWLGSKNFVIYIDHYINAEDFEVELHLKGEQDYLNFLEDLNKNFGRIIKNSFVLKFYDVKVHRYLPLKL